MNASLLAFAQRWADADPDPSTRAATLRWLAQGDEASLQLAFGARLTFGTAGIRGALGPGPNQMSRALVRQVSAGLGRYVAETVPDALTRGVVIGHDARHGSRAFAEDTAAVLAGQGFVVYLYDELAPTPVLAHAVTWLGTAAGVMVTASHNPPQDNGYKVYWGNGAQIIPPHDVGISAAIDAVGGPWAVSVPDLEALRASGQVRAVPEAAWDTYVSRVLGWRIRPGSRGVRAVYTPMHGVGGAPLERLVAAAGHDPLLRVDAQFAPDGDFPTVAFPNPEEPGALDLALARARETGADLILANDPDADRLAVAIPDGQGGYTALTGNQIGLLLADAMLTRRPPAQDPMVATSIVSSSLLRRIAAVHGARYAETLTGFKWIGNAALAHPGAFLMGFEEALGYTVGDVVRDKDGLSAALAYLDLAAALMSEGRSFNDALDSLYRRYGYAGSLGRSITMKGADGAQKIAAIMAALRASPPTHIGGEAVVRTTDVLRGEVHEGGQVRPLDLPQSDVLAYDTAAGGRILARPSGTEPKIKFYFEVIEDLDASEPLSAAASRASARLAAMAADWMARVDAAAP